MIVTRASMIAKYGDIIKNGTSLDYERSHMGVYKPSEFLLSKIPCLPKKIYCHKELYPKLEKVLLFLIEKDLHTEIKTYDGCFNLRASRGLGDISMHSYGIAIDINAKDNPLGKTREDCIAMNLTPFTAEFVSIFRSNGFTPGFDFKSRPDGMHFQLTEIKG